MSIKNGQPAGRAHRAGPSKGVLATAGVAVVAVGAAFALATPLTAFASPTPTSAISVNLGSNGQTPLLTAGQLTALLNARFAPAGAAVTGQADGTSSDAISLLDGGSGVLSSDGNSLTVNVPELSNISPAVHASLGPIGSRLGQLNGSHGQVAGAVNNSVLSINHLLNLWGPNGSVNASVPINLNAAVDPSLTGTTSDGAVTIDPNAGTVSVDLSKLLLDNAISPNDNGTVSLSPDANAQITADITGALNSLGNNVINSATGSVINTPVTVNANVHTLTQPSTGSTSTACTSSNPSSTSTSSTSTSGDNGLLGGVVGTVKNLLGGVVPAVTGTVKNIVCALPTDIIPALLTTLNLNLGGTLGQQVEGTAPPASGSLSVIGVPTPINSGGINNGVGEAIVNNIANTGGNGSGANGNGGTANGSGSSPSGSNNCLDNSSTLALCLSVGGNVGNGSGGALGGLGLGGLNLGGTGVGGINLGGILGGNTSGNGLGNVLGALLNGGGNLPAGISASAGSGGVSVSTGSGSSGSSGNLLNINTGTSGGGLGATVNVGGSSGSSGSGSTSSGSGSLLNVNLGSGSSSGSGSGSSTGGGLNLGGLLNINN